MREEILSPGSATALSRLGRAMTHPVFLAVLVAVPLLCVIALPRLSPDEAIWSYMGRVWVQDGAPPFVGAVDNKPPGIYGVYALCHLLHLDRVFYPRLFGVLAVLGSGYLIYLIVHSMAHRIGAAISMVLFGFAMARKVLDGRFASHPEIFVAAMTVAAVFCLSRVQPSADLSTPQRWLWIALAGFLGASGFLWWKQTGAFSILGLAAFWVLACTPRNLRQTLADLSALTVGGCFAAALLAGFLALADIPLKEYFFWCYEVFRYESTATSMTSRTHRLAVILEAWTRTELIVLLGCFVVFLTIKRRLRMPSGLFWAIAIWAVFDWIGANASGNLFWHQYKQAIPAFAICGGLVGHVAVKGFQASTGQDRATGTGTRLLLAVILVWAPYDTLLTYATHLRSPRTPITTRMGMWIKEHTTPSDFVHCFGNFGPEVLDASRRRSPSRHTNNMFLSVPGAPDELRRDLDRHPPKYIFRHDPNAWSKFLPPDWLRRYLEQNYDVVFDREGHLIYERCGEKK